MAIQSAQDSLTTILCSRMTVLCRIQTCKQSVIEGFVVPAGMAFVCKVLRSIPSACDQRLLARLSCLRRGYYLTVETPVSFMQMGGLPTSAECSPSSQHTRSRGAGDVAMHSKSWPCTRVLKVNGRSTEVVEMKSPAGEPFLARSMHLSICVLRLSLSFRQTRPLCKHASSQKSTLPCSCLARVVAVTLTVLTQGTAHCRC